MATTKNTKSAKANKSANAGASKAAKPSAAPAKKPAKSAAQKKASKSAPKASPKKPASKQAYENFEFHKVYRLMDVFCGVTLSRVYHDILKDRMYTFAAHKYATLAPILLKAHRSDVFGVLAVLNECSADEIAKQNIMETVKQVRDLFQDKDLLDFFKSFGQVDETA